MIRTLGVWQSRSLGLAFLSAALIAALFVGCGGETPAEVVQGEASPEALHARLLELGEAETFDLAAFMPLLHPAERAGFARFVAWLPFKARGRFDLEDEPNSPERNAAWDRARKAHQAVLVTYGLDKVEELRGNAGGNASPMRMLGEGLPAFDHIAFVRDSWAILEKEGVQDNATPEALQNRLFKGIPRVGVTFSGPTPDVRWVVNERKSPEMVFRAEDGRWFMTFERPPEEPAVVTPRDDGPEVESDTDK